MEKLLVTMLGRVWPLVVVALVTGIGATAGFVIDKECFRPAVAEVYGVPS